MKFGSSNLALFLSFLSLLTPSPAWAVFGLDLSPEDRIRKEYYEGDFDDVKKIADTLGVQGNPSGDYHKGLLLANGFGMPKDLKRAAELFNAAAKKNHGPSIVGLAQMHLLGEGGLSDRDVGKKLLDRAESLRDPSTDAKLAAFYAKDIGGKDYKRALSLSESAASNDNPLGHSVLGRLYLFGLGVTKDERLGSKHMSIAAKHEEPYAMVWLAERYLKEHDYKDAYRKLQGPVRHGIPQAEAILGVMYLYGGPKFRANSKKGIQLIKSAAEKGNSRAMLELGEAYLRGRSVPRSNTLAAEWYVKAAEGYIDLGNREQAVATLDKLEAVEPGSNVAAKLRRKLGSESNVGLTPNREPTNVAGTGWLISPGYVVTNNHVVEGGHVVKVRFKDGSSYHATVIVTDASNDIAILELKKTTKMPPSLPIASKGARLGEHVFTVGFPIAVIMGSEPKLTDGVVSSTRGISDDPRLYQISVPVQPGNSGGPLINMNGEVIGIVTSKLSALKVLQITGDLPQNVSYAIKVDYAQLVSKSLPPKNTLTLQAGLASLDVLAARVLPSIVQVLSE